MGESNDQRGWGLQYRSYFIALALSPVKIYSQLPYVANWILQVAMWILHVANVILFRFYLAIEIGRPALITGKTQTNSYIILRTRNERVNMPL
jgi:hypothetical protein